MLTFSKTTDLTPVEPLQPADVSPETVSITEILGNKRHCTRCNQPFWTGAGPTPDGYVSFIGADECEECWLIGK